MVSPDVTCRSPFESVDPLDGDYRITASLDRQQPEAHHDTKGEFRQGTDYIENCQAVAGRTVAL